MSATFPVRGVLGDADSAFEQMLEQAGLPHDDVQCPRADDERSIVLMLQYAIRFIQKKWKHNNSFAFGKNEMSTISLCFGVGSRCRSTPQVSVLIDTEGGTRARLFTPSLC